MYRFFPLDTRSSSSSISPHLAPVLISRRRTKLYCRSLREPTEQFFFFFLLFLRSRAHVRLLPSISPMRTRNCINFSVSSFGEMSLALLLILGEGKDSAQRAYAVDSSTGFWVIGFPGKNSFVYRCRIERRQNATKVTAKRHETR